MRRRFSRCRDYRPWYCGLIAYLRIQLLEVLHANLVHILRPHLIGCEIRQDHLVRGGAEQPIPVRQCARGPVREFLAIVEDSLQGQRRESAGHGAVNTVMAVLLLQVAKSLIERNQ